MGKLMPGRGGALAFDIGGAVIGFALMMAGSEYSLVGLVFMVWMLVEAKRHFYKY